jgi:hypothetical protein
MLMMSAFFVAAVAAQQESEPDFATWSFLKTLYAGANAAAAFNESAPCSSKPIETATFQCDASGRLVRVSVPCCETSVLPDVRFLSELTGLTVLGSGRSRNLGWPSGFFDERSSLSLLRELAIVNSSLLELPSEIGRLTSLTRLELRRCWFERGAGRLLPSQLGALQNLTSLVVTRSRDRSNDAAAVAGGTVPSALGRLLRLTSLDLSFNLLTGQFNFSALEALQSLNLEGSLLTGGLFPLYATALTSCDLFDASVAPSCAQSCPQSCFTDCPDVCCGSNATCAVSTTRATATLSEPTTAVLFVGKAFRASVGVAVAIGLSTLTIIGLVVVALVWNCFRLRRAAQADRDDH